IFSVKVEWPNLPCGNLFALAPWPYLGAILRSMKFKILQDNLRKILWERIEAGELTGLHLAQQTGFKQAHISNFLNRKRGLSLEGIDRKSTRLNSQSLRHLVCRLLLEKNTAPVT